MLISEAVDKIKQAQSVKIATITGGVKCEFCEGSQVGKEIELPDTKLTLCDDHGEELTDIAHACTHVEFK